MKHLTLKATVQEATDQGTFTAVISASSVDRDGDIVEPMALVNAMEKWIPLGKKIPLQWDHQSDPESIVGNIDPASVREVDGEVVASGWIDQEFDRGKHAWRLIKSGTIGFSYGFLILEADERGKGLGLHIKAIDVFEVTVTPAPANGDTRVLEFKSLTELNAAVAELEREREEEQLPEVEVVEPEPVAEVIAPIAPPAEELDAQVKKLERDERARQEEAVLKTALAEQTAATEANAAALADVKAQIADAREAIVALEMFDPTEVAGVKGGILATAWTAAYVQALPDTAFLHTDQNGRHFPIRDAAGTVDPAHVKNALAQIPGFGLSDTVQAQLVQRAERILANQAEVDGTGKEKGAPGRGSRSVDPLRKQADDRALEIASGGMSLQQVKKVEQPKRPEPTMSIDDLRRQMYEATLITLSD